MKLILLAGFLFTFWTGFVHSWPYAPQYSHTGDQYMNIASPFIRSYSVIAGEYIFLCKHDFVQNGIPRFILKMASKYGISIEPKLDVSLGEYRAYLVCGITEEQVNYVRDQYGLEAVEANRFVTTTAAAEYKKYLTKISRPDNVSADATFCYEQDTGRKLWGLSRINQHETLRGGGQYRWSYVDDGTGVDVYVIDSGVNIDHVEFSGRAVRGYTAAQISAKEGEEDLNGHGTHVSGIIAGLTFGVAKAGNIIAVKALDQEGVGTIADIVQGLGYVYNDVVRSKKNKAVVNLSLGSYGTSLSLESAINTCIKAGINVVVASGNDFDDSCSYTPAHVREAITVSAFNVNDQISRFSNYGACVDLFAPGEGIISAYIGGPEAYAISDGTSMASPYVAGAVARYLSHFPDTPPSPAEVIQYFTTIATRDKLDLSAMPDSPAAAATENRMLYIECSRAAVIFSSSARARTLAMGMYVVMVLIGFLARDAA